MVETLLGERVNFLLGKNGCGKSRLLRSTEQRLANTPDWYVRYITPERGGNLTYNAQIEQNVTNSKGWFETSRRVNRLEQFREQSVYQYRQLELHVLREIELDRKARSDYSYTFQTVLDEINSLLPAIQLSRSASGFGITRRENGAVLEAQHISSGESEVIALAIEVLVFARDCQKKPHRLLLLDEPDVHLHPDLQARLIRFVERLAEQWKFSVMIATHSTALLGSMRNRDGCRCAFMTARSGDTIRFEPVTEEVAAIVPLFGAHPLSNIFNESPVLLVEGDDDKRIWEQVVRSCRGKVRLSPCPAGSKDEIGKWETWIVDHLPALYDQPRAFSLRDRDDESGDLEDRPPVIRLRLACRSAENLILSTEALQIAGTSWENVTALLQQWLLTYPNHTCHAAMTTFAQTGFNRRDADLKEIRNVLLAVLGVSKPWEVLVGQAIARATEACGPTDSFSVIRFLGEKCWTSLLSGEWVDA